MRPTSFRPTQAPGSDKRLEFRSLYRELIAGEARNQRICEDVIEALPGGYAVKVTRISLAVGRK